MELRLGTRHLRAAEDEERQRKKRGGLHARMIDKGKSSKCGWTSQTPATQTLRSFDGVRVFLDLLVFVSTTLIHPSSSLGQASREREPHVGLCLYVRVRVSTDVSTDGPGMADGGDRSRPTAPLMGRWGARVCVDTCRPIYSGIDTYLYMPVYGETYKEPTRTGRHARILTEIGRYLRQDRRERKILQAEKLNRKRRVSLLCGIALQLGQVMAESLA